MNPIIFVSRRFVKETTVYHGLMETRLTELEIRYMKQEKAILDLSDVVYRQEVAIERLTREVERLREQLDAMTPGGFGDSGEEPPPPHY